MIPVLHLGPLTLPVAPFALIIAFFALQESGDRASGRLGLPEGAVSSALLWALVAGVICARLGYVLRNLEAYSVAPLQIVAVNVGTLDATLGMLGGSIAVLMYVQRKQIALRTFADAIAPGLALALAIVSVGNILTGDAYGVPARGLPWAIDLWGEPRHPVQLYEAIAYAGIFAWVWKRAPRPFAGATFLITIALLAGARLLLEPLRGDSIAWFAGMRAAQVIALGLLTGALALLVRGWNLKTPRAN